jgi:MFS family permease
MTKDSVNESSWRGWAAALTLSLLSAVTAAATSQFSATLDYVAEQVGTTGAGAAFVDAVKYFFSVGAVLAAPRFIKQYGKRAVFAAGCLVFLIPQVWIPFNRAYGLFVVLKSMQGLCVVLFPLFLVMIADRCAPRDIGLATAILTGFTYAGGAAGGTIAGFCLSRMGWQASYHAISAAMLLTILLAAPVFLNDGRTGGRHSEPATGNTAAGSAVAGDAAAGDESAYRFVVRNRLTWFLIFAFFPTVWTVQSIWSDMIPFGLHLGFSDAQMGGVMSVSALSILAGSLLSGKVSDLAASRGPNRLQRRAAVFALGTVLIMAGAAVLLSADLRPPKTGLFNFVVFFLSFGAAWGLGSFYSIFPEYFRDGEVSAANGFIGGLADMGMPASPMFMAAAGIAGGHWRLAWSSCAFIAAVGLAFSAAILKCRAERTENARPAS